MAATARTLAAVMRTMVYVFAVGPSKEEEGIYDGVQRVRDDQDTRLAMVMVQIGHKNGGSSFSFILSCKPMYVVNLR